MNALQPITHAGPTSRIGMIRAPGTRRVHQSFLLLFLAVLSIPAWASSTMCVFSALQGTPKYDIEFIGYDQVAMIQVHLPGGPRSFPAGSYELVEFDERTSKVHLVYRNPGDPTLPPSFTLKGAGKHVRMSIGENRVVGELNCDY